jgi:hypothetical protein
LKKLARASASSSASAEASSIIPISVFHPSVKDIQDFLRPEVNDD